MAQFDSLLKFLTMMVFWSEVTVEEADIAILTLLGEADVSLPPMVEFSRQVQWPGIKRVDLGIPRDSVVEAHGMALVHVIAEGVTRQIVGECHNDVLSPWHARASLSQPPSRCCRSRMGW